MTLFQFTRFHTPRHALSTSHHSLPRSPWERAPGADLWVIHGVPGGSEPGPRPGACATEPRRLLIFTTSESPPGGSIDHESYSNRDRHDDRDHRSGPARRGAAARARGEGGTKQATSGTPQHGAGRGWDRPFQATDAEG